MQRSRNQPQAEEAKQREDGNGYRRLEQRITTRSTLHRRKSARVVSCGGQLERSRFPRANACARRHRDGTARPFTEHRGIRRGRAGNAVRPSIAERRCTPASEPNDQAVSHATRPPTSFLSEINLIYARTFFAGGFTSC